jgi:hypothetical protein
MARLKPKRSWPVAKREQTTFGGDLNQVRQPPFFKKEKASILVSIARETRARFLVMDIDSILVEIKG